MLSLTLNFFAAVHVFLEDCPLLHMNYVKDLYSQGSQWKTCFMCEFNRQEVEIDFEIRSYSTSFSTWIKSVKFYEFQVAGNLKQYLCLYR